MKNTNIIRNFLNVGLLILLFVAVSNAAPVVRKMTGSYTVDLGFTMAMFRQDLGGVNNGTGGSHSTGRREIDWDEYTPGHSQGYMGYPFQFPYEYYNKAHPRGIVFNTLYQPHQLSSTMLVSRPSNTPGENPYFLTANGERTKRFKPFSGTGVFGAHLDTNVNVHFTIPGTSTPATVNGIGMVFTDVDAGSTTYITLYDEAGNAVYGEYVQASPNGYSFLGVTFTDGTRIARATVKLGLTGLYSDVSECYTANCKEDYVGLDNVIFGEPRAADYHPADFDGDGGADYAVYRPAEGSWYVMNSGSNTFRTVQFGLNGDIPTDGDFDGDSRSDFTVFRPSTGIWYSLRSSDGQAQTLQFGQNGDKPLAKDYDKDGKTDFAVWRPADGNYYVFRSSDAQVQIMHWGANGDIPIGAAGF